MKARDVSGKKRQCFYYYQKEANILLAKENNEFLWIEEEIEAWFHISTIDRRGGRIFNLRFIRLRFIRLQDNKQILLSKLTVTEIAHVFFSVDEKDSVL